MGTFLAKWMLNGIITAPLLLWFAGVSFITAAVASTALTIVAWFIGDQLILRATNNTAAVVMDAVLAAVYFVLLAFFLNWDLGFGEIVIMAVILGVAEWVFHRYFLRDEVFSNV